MDEKINLTASSHGQCDVKPANLTVCHGVMKHKLRTSIILAILTTISIILPLLPPFN